MEVFNKIITGRYKSLFENNPLPIWVYDKNTAKILTVNKAAVETFGYSCEEFLNFTAYDLRPKEEHIKLTEFLGKSIENLEKSGLWKYRKKNGELLAEIIAQDVLFDGSVTRMVMLYDVTDKIRSEQELTKRENLYKTLIDSVDDIIVLFDLQGKIIEVSKQTASLYGYDTIDEMLLYSENGFDYVVPEDRDNVKELLKKLFKEGSIQSLVINMIKKDLSIFKGEINFSVIHGEDGDPRYVLSLIRDVSKRIKAEKDLEYRYKIEQLISEISSFFINLPAQDIDLGIYNALVSVGEFYHLKSCSIWDLSEKDSCISMSYEWVSEGIPNMKEKLQNIFLSSIPWGAEVLRKKEITVINLDNILPNGTFETDIFSKRGINESLAIPLVYENHLIGYLTLTTSEVKNWISADNDLFKILGEIIVNALERKKNDTELIKLSSAVRQTADSIIITDKNGIIEFVNPSFVQLTGYSQDEVIGKKTNILRSGKHDSKFYRKLWETITSGRTYQTEFIDNKKDGTTFLQDCIITPIKSNKGEIIHFVSTGRDITERKRIEEFRKRLGAILEATSDFVSSANLESNIQFINRAGRKLVGIGEHENVTNLKISDFHPKWAYNLIREFGIPISIHEGIWTGETALLTRNGDEIPVSQVIIAHKDSSGNVEYLSTIIRDITDIKKAQDDLRLSEEQYRLLVENQSDIIVKFDSNWKYLYVSNTFYDVFGKTIDELLGTQFSLEQMNGSKDQSQLYDSVFKPPYTCLIERKELTRFGWRWIAWSFKAELNEHERVQSIIGVGRDVTDKQVAEVKLENAYKELEQRVDELEKSRSNIQNLLNEANERKQQLEKLSRDLVTTEETERKKFAIELHDSLGQILTSIKLNLEMANPGFKKNINDSKKFLDEAYNLTITAMQETKKLSYDLRPAVLDDFGLGAAIKMLIQQFEPANEITTELSLEIGEHRYDPIIEAALYRIIQELLTNISKHSKASIISVQLIHRDDLLALNIIDNGIGFDVREVLKARNEEIHFGLRNIRERVEFLKGKLYIDSKQGIGTEVTVEIQL